MAVMPTPARGENVAVGGLLPGQVFGRLGDHRINFGIGDDCRTEATQRDKSGRGKSCSSGGSGQEAASGKWGVANGGHVR